MTAITALLLFAAWTLLLMFTYVTYRTAMVARGESADSWTRGQSAAVPAFFKRAENAHANCVENLPVYAAVVLAAYTLGKAPVVDATASYFILARLAQSAAHLSDVSHVLVLVRAVFYTIQVVIVLWAIAQLLA